jgi:predicted transcriptional regulator
VAKIGRAEYTRRTMQEVKKNFFDGSIKSMFSFFVKEENLSADDIRELLGMLEEEGGAL